MIFFLLACSLADKALDTGLPADSTDVPADDTAAAALAPGDLVISELMMDPAAVDGDFGEWFEIRNLSGTTWDLRGLTVADDDGDGFEVDTALLIDPGGWVVLGPDASPDRNGGLTVDYGYSIDAVKLGNDGDGLTLSWAGAVLDTLVYDTTFPIEEGAAMTLSGASMSPGSNDVSTAWCLATTPYGAGDLGTPGANNDPC